VSGDDDERAAVAVVHAAVAGAGSGGEPRLAEVVFSGDV
jgi:hypothetical protein